MHNDKSAGMLTIGLSMCYHVKAYLKCPQCLIIMLGWNNKWKQSSICMIKMYRDDNQFLLAICYLSSAV